MAEIDYLTRLEKQPPEGFVEWMKPKFRQNYLIYRIEFTARVSGKGKRAVRVHCTACGESWLAEYASAKGCPVPYPTARFGFVEETFDEAVYSGKSTPCPKCGEGVTAIHVGAFGRTSTLKQEKWAMSAGRIDDTFVVYGWIVRREISKQNEQTYSASPYEAYVFERRKCFKYVGYWKHYSQVKLLDQWCPREKAIDTWIANPKDSFYPAEPGLLNGSTMCNSKFDLYLKTEGDELYPVSYLRAYQKHNNIENLITQGAGKIVNELIGREVKCYGFAYNHCTPRLPTINWKEKRPSKMLGIPPEAMRTLKAQNWTAAELECIRDLNAAEPIRLPDDMVTIRQFGASGVKAIASAPQRGSVPVMRCLHYLEKQAERGGSASMNWTVLLRDWWRLAAEEARNLEDISVKLPKNLRYSHDHILTIRNQRTTEQRIKEQAERIAARAARFEERRSELEPYTWETADLIIRPCRDEPELIREGNTLHHCVATYAQSICEKSTAILFIRRKEAPEEPFFTLEFDTEKLNVIQNRGLRNCPRTPEVLKFEEEWLMHIRNEQRRSTKTT